MTDAIQIMAGAIADALGGGLESVWLYGSAVLGDFRLGWSDLDFIALASEPLTAEQAERLLTLRQELSKKYPESPYFRLFEGVIACAEEYFGNSFTRLVYWGTSGQRITNRYSPDVFSRLELARCGRSVFGAADRSVFSEPARDELVGAVRGHLNGIRQCAVLTDESLYSCGWLLDIARCIYTLRKGGVIGKTQAGEWALAEHIFADEEPLEKTLLIRKNPIEYKENKDVKAWLASLGPTVQRYADVLEKELDGIRKDGRNE